MKIDENTVQLFYKQRTEKTAQQMLNELKKRGITQQEVANEFKVSRVYLSKFGKFGKEIKYKWFRALLIPLLRTGGWEDNSIPENIESKKMLSNCDLKDLVEEIKKRGWKITLTL